MRKNQSEIIRNLDTVPSINPTAEIERRSQFLADYLGQRVF